MHRSCRTPSCTQLTYLRSVFCQPTMLAVLFTLMCLGRSVSSALLCCLWSSSPLPYIPRLTLCAPVLVACSLSFFCKKLCMYSWSTLAVHHAAAFSVYATCTAIAAALASNAGSMLVRCLPQALYLLQSHAEHFTLLLSPAAPSSTTATLEHSSLW